MAYTFSDATASKLAKVRLGGKDYNLKDEAAREIIAKLNPAIVENTIGEITAGGTNLVNSGTLDTAFADFDTRVTANTKAIDALKEAVAGGLVIEVVEELPTPTAQLMGKLYLVKHAHAAPATPSGVDTYDEWLVVRSGAAEPYTYTWEKIGNTDIDLSVCVSNISYDAATHKLSQTKGKNNTTPVHTFGKFADADKGTANTSVFLTAVAGKVTPNLTFNVTTGDGTPVTGGSLGSQESAGFIPVPQAINSITTIDPDKLGTPASKAKDSFTANRPTAIDTTKFNGGTAASIEDGFFSAGSLPSKAADQFTANTPALVDVTKFVPGSKAADTFTKASIATKPTKSFTTNGIVGSVEGETLVFTNASTATAVTDVTINGGSFTEGKFTAPSLGTGFFTPGTAASFTEGAFTKGTLPSINTAKFHGGTAASLGTGFYTAGTAASFTEGTFTPNTVPSVKVTNPSFYSYRYYKYDGAESTVTITPTKGKASVEVTPVAK